MTKGVLFGAMVWLPMMIGPMPMAGASPFGPGASTGPSTFVQMQFALASESDFLPALLLRYERPDEVTDVLAVSLGRQFSDSLLGWPAEVVAYGGVQRFGERGLQPDILGATVFVKASRIFHLGKRRFPLRLGLAEGLSYVSRIPVVESEDFAPLRSAKLTNYLEWTMQTSLGYLLGHRGRRFSSSIRDVYIGYGIFHRSTAFGLFASTGGGINYMGIGIEAVVD